ncbi:tetratricopeptide repeat protein [Streptomyces sp. NPDC051771]|uniref:tetratricopeptide repeat protein n=1 Tax=Streptomyces sp. NPDC051771 TaxID=3154847 RepID=UPI0034137AB6
MAETLNLTGSLLIDMGRPQDAFDTYREALDIARTVGATLDEAHALEGAARSQLALGAPDQALLLLQDAETLYRDLQAPAQSNTAELLAIIQHKMTDAPGGV